MNILVYKMFSYSTDHKSKSMQDKVIVITDKERILNLLPTTYKRNRFCSLIYLQAKTISIDFTYFGGAPYNVT